MFYLYCLVIVVTFDANKLTIVIKYTHNVQTDTDEVVERRHGVSHSCSSVGENRLDGMFRAPEQSSRRVHDKLIYSI